MSIRRDSLAYWISQASNFVLAFITSIFVARILGPERRGLFVAVLLANTLTVNLTNLGAQAMAMYFVSKEPHQLSLFHTLILKLVGAIAILDIIVIAVAGRSLAAAIGGQSVADLLDNVPMAYLAVALALLPFSLYIFAAQGVLTGLGRVYQLSGYLFGYSVATGAANLAVLWLAPHKVEGLIAVWAISQVAGSLVLFALIRRASCRWMAMTLPETARQMRRLLSYGLRVFAGTFAVGLQSRTDQIFIFLSAGKVDIGIYSLSAKLAELTSQPSHALTNAGFSTVSRLERSRAARLVQDLFRTNFILNAFAAIVLVLIARPLILILYGEEYANGIAPLQVLLPGAVFLSSTRVLAIYFSAQLGKPQYSSAIAWLTLAVNLPLMWWVVVHSGRGLIGAAWVTAGCYVFLFLCFIVLFSSLTGLVNPAAYFLPQRRDVERFKSLARDVVRRRGV